MRIRQFFFNSQLPESCSYVNGISPPCIKGTTLSKHQVLRRMDRGAAYHDDYFQMMRVLLWINGEVLLIKT